MKALGVKIFFTGIIFFFTGSNLFAQPSFVDIQRSSTKIAEIFNIRADSLKKGFAAMKISWPPQSLYIRCFKFDQLMEVWVKGEDKKQYRLFKTYAICMQIGNTGPKRKEGDLQIPEGFYYINEFNPNSNYHLSLGLNYPNASDEILSDSLHPGGEIFIHGNCVSIGCLAINDLPIEELYVLATYAIAAGQDFIPVHVFPVKYNEKRSIEYLQQSIKDDLPLRQFAYKLKEAFDLFNEKKQLPLILVNPKGEYIID